MQKLENLNVDNQEIIHELIFHKKNMRLIIHNKTIPRQTFSQFKIVLQILLINNWAENCLHFVIMNFIDSPPLYQNNLLFTEIRTVSRSLSGLKVTAYLYFAYITIFMSIDIAEYQSSLQSIRNTTSSNTRNYKTYSALFSAKNSGNETRKISAKM